MPGQFSVQDTIDYFSKKQGNVTLSSSEAEFVAMSSATQQSYYLKMLMEEIGLECGPGVAGGFNDFAMQCSCCMPVMYGIPCKHYFGWYVNDANTQEVCFNGIAITIRRAGLANLLVCTWDKNEKLSEYVIKLQAASHNARVAIDNDGKVWCKELQLAVSLFGIDAKFRLGKQWRMKGCTLFSFRPTRTRSLEPIRKAHFIIEISHNPPTAIVARHFVKPDLELKYRQQKEAKFTVDKQNVEVQEVSRKRGPANVA
ncbi:hypothetical protein MP228_006908 [Amoeboaphelidium protococcarum]|nr:hypothetical protein MP228_006908 [Amoeboaphelidium protococcarum]